MFRFPAPDERPPRWIAVLTLAIALIVGGERVRADDDEAIESLLTRLGLVDLHVIHLESRVKSAQPGPPREKLAQRLADLYAERLMNSAEDRARYDDTVRRIEALIRDIPQANTPALRVMLLQADYTRAETLIVKWLNDRDETAALAEANQVLARIAPSLEEYYGTLNKNVETMFSELDAIKDEDQRETKQQALTRLQAVAGRATYFAGWANYYLGVGKQNVDAAKGQFTTARKAFQQLLDLPADEPYDDVDAEWLGLESIWRSRALIGLGLSEAALGNLAGSRVCFRLLDDVRTPPMIRDQGAYWFLQGMLNAGHLAEAAEYAAEQIEKYSGGATDGKIGFCVALVRAGFADSGNPSPVTRHLGELGIRGLAQLRQFPVIRQLMTKYKIEVGGASGFYLTWIKGQQQFAAAEESKQPDEYKTAAQTLASALEDAQAKNDVISAGQCRYNLAWCHFRLEDFAESARHFEQAVSALKQAGGSTAAESAWMALVSYCRLAAAEKRYTAAAIDAAKTLKREFPGTDHAKNADYLITKLEQSSASVEESIRALQDIKPGDPQYLASRFDLCLLHHRRWSQAREDKAQAGPAARDLQQSVDAYLTAAKRDADESRKLRATLLVVDAALTPSPPDFDNGRAYLDKAEPFATSLPTGDSAVVEYYYWMFRLAKETDDASGQRRHAQWLIDNARGSAYERSAIVTMAVAADEAVKSAAAAALRQRQQEAAGIYTRLVDLLGDSSEAIANDKNARIANSRLADYEYDLGQFDKAGDRLEKVLATQPDSKTYLRRTGLAQFHAGRHTAALAHWRKLTAGLEKGSEPWFEAKYYQIACLAKTDKETAGQVHRQLNLLYPDVPFANWRDKLRGLESTLE